MCTVSERENVTHTVECGDKGMGGVTYDPLYLMDQVIIFAVILLMILMVIKAQSCQLNTMQPQVLT